MNTFVERTPSGSVRPADLADWLVSHGIAVLTSEECAHLIGVPRNEVPQRLARLRAQGKFVSLSRGLWAVVPAEVRMAGAPEPMRYIDALMSYCGCEYCVGWLSAAALRGASHQAPQVFQVAVERQLKDRTIGRSSLEFHKRSYVSRVTANSVSLSSGTAVVASAGTTMLMAAADLMICSGIDNVATIVVELAEQNDGYLSEVMADLHLFPESAACRLGWILEHVASADNLESLSNYCRDTGEPTMLSPYGSRSGKIDKTWNVIENRAVEVDV